MSKFEPDPGTRVRHKLYPQQEGTVRHLAGKSTALVAWDDGRVTHVFLDALVRPEKPAEKPA